MFVGLQKVREMSIFILSLLSISFFYSFDRFIGESTSTMKKIKLNLKGASRYVNHRIVEQKEHVQLYRQYRHVEISCHRLLNDTYKHSLWNQVYIRKLDLTHTMLSESTYLGLLKSLTLLEDLTIASSSIAGRNRLKTIEAVPMPALKSITLADGQFLFLAFINGANVACLKISKLKAGKSKNDIKGAFFSSLSSLEDLYLELRNYNLFKSLTNDCCQLALKKLRIFSWNDEQNYDIIKFLATQKDTVDDLTIDNRRRQDMSKVYEFILSQMNIKSWTINLKHLPQEEHFFNTVKENKELVKVEILPNSFITQENVQKVFKACRNIEQLKFSEFKMTKPIMQHISKLLPKLRCLEFRNTFQSDCTRKVKLDFNSVQFLTLEEDHSRFSGGINTYVLNLPELRMLKLNFANFELTGKFMEAVKLKCPHLHTLKLQKNAWTEDFLSRYREDKIRIHLQSTTRKVSVEEKDKIKIKFA
jgi:hypothetical protein